MFNWGALTLFLYILLRMTGFIAFNPLFSRNGIPRTFLAGLIGMLSMCVFYSYQGSVEMPEQIWVFGLRGVLEVTVGFLLGTVMRFFFYIAEHAGETVDTQMGLSMARMYDPGSRAQMTVTANMLNSMMLLLFFAENGHITMLRLIMTSGELVPFGQVALGEALLERILEIFVECTILAVKLTLPIFGAEMMGQVGMGVLNKVIPQINVFVINIDVKVLIGLGMLVMLISPIANLLLEVETTMLREFRALLMLMRG